MSDIETISKDAIEQQVELEEEKKDKRRKATAAPKVTSATEKARAIVRAKLAAR